MKKPNSKVRSKVDRKKKADELMEERAKLTDKQQLARLDNLFGDGKGAKKERARLKSRMRAAQSE